MVFFLPVSWILIVHMLVRNVWCITGRKITIAVYIQTKKPFSIEKWHMGNPRDHL